VMRGVWMTLQHHEPGDYVFAGGVGRKVRDVVDVAFAHVGLDPERYIRVDPAFVRGVEPTPLVGDPTRARTVLGWEPEVSFEEMIAAMVEADLEALSGRAARGQTGS
jgi:GDPmannose 4,6-dehydratase